MSRVLFIHGLESSPQSTKVQKMRDAGFDVHAVDMHVSKYNIIKKHAMIRSVFRTQSFRYWLLLTMGMIGFSMFRHLPWTQILMLFLVGNIFLYFWRRNLIAEAWKISVASSIAIQEKAILDFKPNVIVGSSYGGAITCELIRRGIWTGPTILLAPAYNKILESTRISEREDHLEKIRESSHHHSLLIFHDPRDSVVPYEDSVTLAKNSNIELISPDAGGHRLLGILEDSQLFEKLRKL